MNGLLSMRYVAKPPKWLLPPDKGRSASVARSMQKVQKRSGNKQSIPTIMPTPAIRISKQCQFFAIA
jgi:hypothetical protein